MLWLGVLAIVGAHGGGGPFVSRPPLEATLSILVFLVVTSIPLLLLAAAMEERRSLARGRQRSEERFRSLFEHNIIPTVLWRDGCISDANDAFLQMTGYTSAEVSTGNLRRDLLASGLPDGGGPPMERELMLRDGRRIPALIGACRFRGDTSRAPYLPVIYRVRAMRKPLNDAPRYCTVRCSRPSTIRSWFWIKRASLSMRTIHRGSSPAASRPRLSSTYRSAGPSCSSASMRVPKAMSARPGSRSG